MPILEPAELQPILKPGERLMGLDLGTKTIGIALSDTTRMVATPFQTLKRERFGPNAEELERIVAEFKVAAIVIGLPLNMDGSSGPRVQATRAFARNLLARGDKIICFWDERLSTAAAERGMIAGDVTRQRRREIIDRSAAAYILQGFLDRLANLTPPAETESS